MRTDDPLILRLLETIQRDSVDMKDTASNSMGIASLRIDEALKFVSDLQSATNRCDVAIQSSRTRYHIAPDMQQLLIDLELARVYATQREEIEGAFIAHIPDLPADAKPFRTDGWIAAMRGVESADKLSRTFGNSPVLREIVCTAGQVNPEALNMLCQSTDAALQQVSKIWSEQIAFIELTNPGQQEIEPRKRIATELKACAGAAAAELEAIAARLSMLLTVLKTATPFRWSVCHKMPMRSMNYDVQKAKLNAATRYFPVLASNTPSS